MRVCVCVCVCLLACACVQVRECVWFYSLCKYSCKLNSINPDEAMNKTYEANLDTEELQKFLSISTSKFEKLAPIIEQGVFILKKYPYSEESLKPSRINRTPSLVSIIRSYCHFVKPSST